mmetsp:Transcript_11834/g.14750  ORF Transcript_11834/g.14750 Transcript_11834/m.14750 type:complete len:144 (-) Transcript_11834:799-1230(-)
MGNSLAASLLSGYHCSKANVLLLGLDGAGKTTIQYQLKPLQQVLPSVGFSFVERTEHENMNIAAWDLCNGRTNTYLHDILSDATHLIFVVDAADENNIPIAKKELWNVLNSQELANVPVLVLANKKNLPGAQSVELIYNKNSS